MKEVETVFQENSGGWRSDDETPGMLNEPNPRPGWWRCEELPDGGRRWEWGAPLDAWEPKIERDDGCPRVSEIEERLHHVMDGDDR